MLGGSKSCSSSIFALQKKVYLHLKKENRYFYWAFQASASCITVTTVSNRLVATLADAESAGPQPRRRRRWWRGRRTIGRRWRRRRIRIERVLLPHGPGWVNLTRVVCSRFLFLPSWMGFARVFHACFCGNSLWSSLRALGGRWMLRQEASCLRTRVAINCGNSLQIVVALWGRWTE